MENEILTPEGLPEEPTYPAQEPTPPTICTLTLADGTELPGLVLNGNNYVSETKIDEAVFAGNLDTLTISDGETESVMQHVQLIQQVYYPDADPAGWYLCFREMTPEELRAVSLDAAIYVSRLALAGETIDTDDKRLRASGLYPNWTPGNHTAGEHYNARGQTWECFQAYDNGVYPDIRPGETAWYTFNRPLHGTTPETARPFVPAQESHDMYRAGEYMIWTDGGLYQCLSDTNFSPAEYAQAWGKVSDSDTGKDV